MSLLWIAWKDLSLVLRDRAAVLFLVLVPVVVITIIAETQGDELRTRLQIPVVNEDAGPVAQALIDALAEHADVFEVDLERAQEMVGSGDEAAAILILPERLSKNYMAGLSSTLTLVTDPVRRVEIATIKALLLLADKQTSSLADPLYEDMLVLEERNATGSRLTIPPIEIFVPGFSLMFVLMGVLFGVAFGLQDEREWGSLTRLRMAPISRASLLGGKLLARFGIGFAQLVLLFGLGHLVYGISLGRSPAAFLVLAAAIVFSLTGFSLLVSAFARTREQIIPLGMTVVMIVCAIGGCWWPIYDAPPWLQNAALAFPTRWSMEGIHDLALREQGLAGIAPTLAMLVAYGSACLALGVRLNRLD